MIKGYEIVKFEEIHVFAARMKNFNERTIECTPHTLFRLDSDIYHFG